MQEERSVIGARIKRFREAKGFSRRDLARTLAVDTTALAAWECGKYLPLGKRRIRLAQALGADLAVLFRAVPDDRAEPLTAMLVDTVTELSSVLLELTHGTKQKLRALRLAAPYSTSAYVQEEWRRMIDKRLLAGTLEVQRIEIFYNLRRLQETLSNILRYDGRAYHVKSYCAGLAEVAPAMGGYFFDESDFVLGAYWTGMPPHNRPGIHMSGTPFRAFFSEYWSEIWRRGTLLNISGAHDLSAVKVVAIKLGLQPSKWKSFLEEARALEIGDGAPPLI